MLRVGTRMAGGQIARASFRRRASPTGAIRRGGTSCLQRQRTTAPTVRVEHSAGRRRSRSLPKCLLTPILHQTRRLIHVVWRDISERKRMETALRESEFFLKESQKIGRMGGWRADPRTNTLMWTEGVYAVLEMPFGVQAGSGDGPRFLPPARANAW